METRLLGQQWTIKKTRRSRLSENEIAEFLTTLNIKCKNTQNISIDGCYLRFEEYLQEKNIFWNRAEKYAKVLKNWKSTSS